MQDGRLVLDSNRSPFFEIAAAGPDEREYDPVPRRVTASADALAALRGIGGVVTVRKGKNGKLPQVGLSAAAKQRMVVRYGELGSVLDVAREFGVSVLRVREILRLAGVNRRGGRKVTGPDGASVVEAEAVKAVEAPLGLGDVVEEASVVEAVEVTEVFEWGNGPESETESEIVKECVMPIGVRVELSEEQERGIVARYAAMETAKGLIAEFGISMQRLQQMVEKYGHEWRGRGKKGATDLPRKPSGLENTDKRRNGASAAVHPDPRSAAASLPSPTPPVGQAPGGMVVEVQELEVVRPPMGHRDMPREYVPPAIVRTGQLRAVEPVSLLQPELVGDGRDVLVQLGRLNNLIRELRSIEGVVVQGSVSIALNVEAQI